MFSQYYMFKNLGSSSRITKIMFYLGFFFFFTCVHLNKSHSSHNKLSLLPISRNNVRYNQTQQQK